MTQFGLLKYKIDWAANEIPALIPANSIVKIHEILPNGHFKISGPNSHFPDSIIEVPAYIVEVVPLLANQLN